MLNHKKCCGEKKKKKNAAMVFGGGEIQGKNEMKKKDIFKK